MRARTATDAELLQVFADAVFPISACGAPFDLVDLGLVCKAWRAAVELCRPTTVVLNLNVRFCRSFGDWLAKYSGRLEVLNVEFTWNLSDQMPETDIAAFHAAFAAASSSVQELRLTLTYFGGAATGNDDEALAAGTHFLRRAHYHAVSSANLRALHLNCCGVLRDIDLLALQPHLYRLQRLQLDRGDKFTDACAPVLASCTALTSLEIACTGITNTGFAQLSTLVHLRELLAYAVELDASAFDTLRHMTALQTLQLVQREAVNHWQPGGPMDVDEEGRARLRVLAGMTTLETLELNLCDEQVTAGAIGALSRLRSLKLHRAQLDQGHAALSNLVALAELELHSGYLSAGGLQVVARLPQLRALVLDGPLVDLGSEAADALAQATGLESLTITCDSWSYVQGVTDKVPALTRLTRLALHNIAVNSYNVSEFSALTALRELEVCACCVTSDGASQLLGLSALTDLTYLNLSSQEMAEVQDHCFEFSTAAAIGGISSLQDLDVSHNFRLGPSGARALGVLPNLRNLNVSCCSIGDAGVADVCRLLTGLTRLDLGSENQLTDACFEQSLPRLSNLVDLFVSDEGNCFERSLDDLAEDLAKALPNMRPFQASC